MTEITLNDIIVQRIKAARAERNKTQKDLADHLKKTPAAISDLERGKVQVSASDLYQISQLLNKPIEYFYGEEIGDSEIQDMVAVLRRSPKESRIATLTVTSQLIRMQQIADQINEFPDGQKPPEELVQEFYKIWISFATAMSQANTKLQKVRQTLDEAIEPKKLTKLSTSRKNK